MRRGLLVLLLSGIIVFGTGCAFTKQHMTLKPVIDNFGSSVGGSQEVAVKIVDDRDEAVVGHRAVSGSGAEITLSDNTMDIIKGVVFDSLKKNGFKPVEFNESAEKQLQVTVRMIKYHVAMGFATGGIHTTAAFKANVKNKGEQYEQMYRIENEKRVVFIPFENENEGYINGTVSEALQKLHHDNKLMAFLAK